MENQNKFSGKFAKFMSNASDKANALGQKASDFGKKAADSIQKGAKELGDHTQQARHDQKMKKYNPLFRDKFFSENFTVPNVIQIVDDAVRRDIDVCCGAIGWTYKVKDVEVLFLYDEFVADSGIIFTPYAKCDAIYCVDAFDKKHYINSDSIFDRAMSEKIAELTNVAYCLGAKNCSVELSESDSRTVDRKSNFGLKIKECDANAEYNYFKEKSNNQGGKNVINFEGNNVPVRPALKWFSNDQNIKNLIEMRCSGNNSIKHQRLQFHGSSSETMSEKSAIAIDALKKTQVTVEMKSRFLKEHSTLMILDIQF